MNWNFVNRNSVVYFVTLCGSLFFSTQAALAAPPYPQSPVIATITWDTNTLVELAPGSDLWPVTWGADGHLYTSFGDGGGFGGTNTSGRVSMGISRIEGSPTNMTTANVNGGLNSENTPSWNCTSCGKTGGMISVDGTLYIWLNEQNTAKNYRLAWSSDNGATWQKASWAFPEDSFWPRTFLNFGQDNQGARDTYVYIYGYGKGTGLTDQFLVRVPKGQLATRSNYEFFAGLDGSGNPSWTTDITLRQPVLTDPNGIDTTTVVYNAGINRYIATTSQDGTAGKLAIFDAPEPWGPWTTVAYYSNWLNHGTDEALMWSFPTKWMSADGLTMWCIYSSWPAHDNFNLLKVTLTLQTPVTPPPSPTKPGGMAVGAATK